MKADTSEQLRNFIRDRLNEKGAATDFKDSDSLFVSARLDSLDAMETVVFLEESFGVNFTKTDFNRELIDSIDAIMAFIEKP